MLNKKPIHSRIKAQSTREWAYEYETGKPVWPKAWGGEAEPGYITTPDDFESGWRAGCLDSKEQKIFNPKETMMNEINPKFAPSYGADPSQLFECIGYTTRKDKHGNGRLVLEFIGLETGEEVYAYFNIEITHQRGANKGLHFKTGRNAQFWPKPHSKFWKLWVQLFAEPERWSTVYSQMNKMKSCRFSGKVLTKPTYREIVELKKA